LYGIERARREAESLTAEAIAELKGLRGPVKPLAALARFVVERNR
jgi:geranylgeranyl pyrophosphate synthase